MNVNSNRRQRREPTPGEFQDPLSNYETPAYADDLERSLIEDRVTVIQSNPFMQVQSSTTIREAMRIMAEQDIACLVVTDEQNKVVGVLSERDVLMRVAEDYAALAGVPVRAVMTPQPTVVYETTKPAHVMNLMSEGLFRHVPVVDADGRLTGMIGARRLIAYLQKFFPAR